MQIQEQNNLVVPEGEVVKPSKKPFIEANTKEVSLSHLSEDCVIPVFSKDNETTISHQEFINTARQCAQVIFDGQTLLEPEVRISHVVKGRVPSAIGKPVKDLLDHEKTVYYERMAFAIEIPSISREINGHRLNLVLGGVRAYNQENLYSRKTLEKFKFFIGFKNMVCCNMCVSSDGYVGDLRVGSINELQANLLDAIGSFQMQDQLELLLAMPEYGINEQQFAQLIGKCRLYNYLPKSERQGIHPLLLNDGQIGAIARQYYEDEHFGRDSNGDLTLWDFYNLLTGANKTSYVDTFVQRGVNALEITQMLQESLQSGIPNWYLT